MGLKTRGPHLAALPTARWALSACTPTPSHSATTCAGLRASQAAAAAAKLSPQEVASKLVHHVREKHEVSLRGC